MGSNERGPAPVHKEHLQLHGVAGDDLLGRQGRSDETGDIVRTLGAGAIRLPRDLIYGNFRAVASELAILWPALVQGAGLKTLPGGDSRHAFPVLQPRLDARRSPSSSTPSGFLGGTSGKAASWEQAIDALRKPFNVDMATPTHGYLSTSLELQACIRPWSISETNRAELVKLPDDRRAKHRPPSRGGGLSVSSRWVYRGLWWPPPFR